MSELCTASFLQRDGAPFVGACAFICSSWIGYSIITFIFFELMGKLARFILQPSDFLYVALHVCFLLYTLSWRMYMLLQICTVSIAFYHKRSVCFVCFIILVLQGPMVASYVILRGLQTWTYWDFINQVAIDVEREEDEGGTVGETFTDYVSTLSIDFDPAYGLEDLLSNAYRYQH